MNSRVCRRSFWFGQGARSCVAVIAVFAGSSAAMASTCGGLLNSRPGTPDATSAVAKSPTSIEFSWRNLTNKGMNKSGTVGVNDQPHEMYFDIYVRDAKQGQLGKDETGTGPFKGLVYGSRSSKVFDGLLANKAYCFALRARTGGGTQGCISELTSAWACATTPPVGAPVVAENQPPKAVSPTMSAAGKPGNVITISGQGFTPNALVTVRVTDQSLRSVWTGAENNGQPIRASPGGAVNVTFNGLCKSPGLLFFSANDGRKVPPNVDVTETLWSKTATITCT
jgi:hypothetical protein